MITFIPLGELLSSPKQQVVHETARYWCRNSSSEAFALWKKSWEFTNETGILTNKNVLFYRPSYDLVQQTIAI